MIGLASSGILAGAGDASARRLGVGVGLFSASAPSGLVYPVRYSDGEYFHAEAKATQCRKDFSGLSYPDEVFRESKKCLDFDDLVRQVAEELVPRRAAPGMARH